MKFQTILWVEDNPDLQYFPIYFRGGETATQFAQSFLGRTTIAYDLEMAMQKISERSFDLYILDADFPQRMKEDRKKLLQLWEEELRRTLKRPDDYKPMTSWDADTLSGGDMPGGGNEFRKLHESGLRGKQAVVFSVSREAPSYACTRDLPFFHKYGCEVDFDARQMAENVKRVRHFINGELPADELIDQWSERCGSAERLTKAYIMA